MTTREYHIYLQNQLFNIGIFNKSNIEPEELDLVINGVFSKFVRATLNPKETKSLGLEDVQLNVDDLKRLKVLDASLPPQITARGVYGVLPSNYSSLISDKSLVAIDCKGVFQTKIVPNRLIDTENKEQYLESAISSTSKNSPVSEMAGDRLYVYTSDFEVRDIIIDYYRKLNKVDIVNSPNVQLDFADDTLYTIAEVIVNEINETKKN